MFLKQKKKYHYVKSLKFKYILKTFKYFAIISNSIFFSIFIFEETYFKSTSSISESVLILKCYDSTCYAHKFLKEI